MAIRFVSSSGSPGGSAARTVLPKVRLSQPDGVGVRLESLTYERGRRPVQDWSFADVRRRSARASISFFLQQTGTGRAIREWYDRRGSFMNGSTIERERMVMAQVGPGAARHLEPLLRRYASPLLTFIHRMVWRPAPQRGPVPGGLSGVWSNGISISFPPAVQVLAVRHRRQQVPRPGNAQLRRARMEIENSPASDSNRRPQTR